MEFDWDWKISTKVCEEWVNTWKKRKKKYEKERGKRVKNVAGLRKEKEREREREKEIMRKKEDNKEENDR